MMERLVSIRGAITVKENFLTEIKNATKHLMHDIFNQNKIDKSKIINIIFTVTDDLDLLNPATVAREEFKLVSIPMLCLQEMKLRKGLPRCIRVLIQTYVDSSDLQSDLQIKHVYLGEAANLRPDLSYEIYIHEPDPKFNQHIQDIACTVYCIMGFEKSRRL